MKELLSRFINVLGFLLFYAIVPAAIIIRDFILWITCYKSITRHGYIEFEKDQDY